MPFPEINELYVETTLPFSALLNDVSESENVVDTPPAFSEASLFLL
jgi:hypothetical protein